jgi:N-acetylglucosaminyldiphosphoundecaprenol N-acetyl-beta-D-mannosaminyltransferase
MRRDPDLDADVRSGDLIGIDGMGIVLAARLFGLPARERVSGIDLMEEVLKLCANEGFRPYFLGATRAVVHAAAMAACAKYPALILAGARDGFFQAREEAQVVESIRASKADCLFVGMPTPKKEKFLAAYRDQVGVPFIMGVGGSFDILAGNLQRAPIYWQRIGMEWLFRIYQEPRRMWWRYVKTNTIFAGIILRALILRSDYEH